MTGARNVIHSSYEYEASIKGGQKGLIRDFTVCSKVSAGAVYRTEMNLADS